MSSNDKKSQVVQVSSDVTLRRPGRPKGSRDAQPRARKIKSLYDHHSIDTELNGNISMAAGLSIKTEDAQLQDVPCCSNDIAGQTVHFPHILALPSSTPKMKRIIVTDTQIDCAGPRNDCKLDESSDDTWLNSVPNLSNAFPNSLDPFHDDWPHWK